MLRGLFFECLEEAGWGLHAWALLSNHYHFIASLPTGSLWPMSLTLSHPVARQLAVAVLQQLAGLPRAGEQVAFPLRIAPCWVIMGTMTRRRAKFVRRVEPLVVLSLGWWERPLQAIVNAARERGWTLLDLEFTRGALPADPPPSGALVNCPPTAPLAKRLRKMGCPTVRLGYLSHPRDRLLPAVLSDMVATGRLAADHFADRGFKHVAYVGHVPWSSHHLAYKAFRARAAEQGLVCHLYRFATGDRRKGESDAARFDRRARQIGAWLVGLPKPIGVLTYSDGMAAGLSVMCRRAGLTVPEDVALLGIGNSPLLCEMSPVHLSSIDRNEEEMGRQAALLLNRLMQGGAAPRKPVMIPPARIAARRSTDVLAVDDPAVARAMRVMWDHLDQNLGVDHVAAEVGMTRRSLERTFRKHLGRGINAELRRKRLERCCELLRTTRLSVSDLAPAVGFRSKEYLHNAFRRAFGITPLAYRQHATERAE
jgi:LacI family transcriptional regulator